jgi:hypothetical protein
MYTNNDIAKIDPPKTMAELNALDATREVPYLKARCNRMHIHVPPPNPSPGEIIPYIERALAIHLKDPVREAGPMSGDFMEWKLIREEYEEFISYLRALMQTQATPSRHPSHQSHASHQSHPPSYTERHESEPKPNQKRTDSEPPSQTPPSQHSQVNQKRTESESNPDQNRNDSEPSAQKTSKQAETPPNDPPKIDRDAIAAQIDKYDLAQTVQCMIDQEMLPNPEKVGLQKFGSAFLDLAGPPRRVRLDELNPKSKFFILGLLEENSLEKVQRKLLLPPPFGPYWAASKSALRRFRLREHAREAKRNQRAMRKQIAELKSDAENPEAEFTAITEKLLKLRLVEASLNPDPDLTQTKTLVEMLEKIHAGKLAERKVLLAESKS